MNRYTICNMAILDCTRTTSNRTYILPLVAGRTDIFDLAVRDRQIADHAIRISIAKQARVVCMIITGACRFYGNVQAPNRMIAAIERSFVFVEIIDPTTECVAFR